MVVAAKQLQAADGRDRECRVQVHCGTHMVTVEGQSKGLNPVWNKPVVMEVLPDVQAVSFEVLDRLGTATNGGKWLGTLQVPLDELAEVRPALNARTKWTRRVPHPVLIGHAATGGRSTTAGTICCRRTGRRRRVRCACCSTTCRSPLALHCSGFLIAVGSRLFLLALHRSGLLVAVSVW